MSSVLYEPETHNACSREEIQAISESLNLHCSPAMLDALTDKSNEALKSLSLIDKEMDFVPEVKYPRTPGHKPAKTDSVGNAWAWRCDVKGAGSGKLFGKTIAIKDNCAVAGVPMSNGSLVLEGYTPEYDATVVTRILDAGGHILGKASCDDFCFSTTGFSATDGYAQIPGKEGISVGGSSSGSAVLVAVGEVDMAIAGDQGGSIRIPASYTGTVGLKPTHGLVPYTGIVAVEPMIDHVGPIARTVEDCALMLEVIAGNDGLDARQNGSLKIVPEYSKLLDVDVRHKTIGYLTEGFECCVEKDLVQKSADALCQLAGIQYSNVSVPMHTHAVNLIVAICAQGATSGMMDFGTCCRYLKGFFPTSLEKAVRQGMQTSARLLSPGGASFLVVGELFNRRYGNHYYNKARNQTERLSQLYDRALENHDVLVMPTLTHAARPLVEVPPGTSDAKAHKAYVDSCIDMVANTCAFNLTGHPALSLPLGPLGDGTYPSLMIVGRKYDELTVLHVARALEKHVTSVRESLK